MSYLKLKIKVIEEREDKMNETKTYLIKAPKVVLVADPIYYNKEYTFLQDKYGLGYENENNNKYCIVRIAKANNQLHMCRIIIATITELAKECAGISFKESEYEWNPLKNSTIFFEILVDDKIESFKIKEIATPGTLSVYGDYCRHIKTNNITITLFSLNQNLPIEEFEERIKTLFSCSEKDIIDSNKFDNNTKEYLNSLCKKIISYTTDFDV